MFKSFTNKGKKKHRNTDSSATDTASINSTASGSNPSQTVITPTVPRRAATMEPDKSRGLVVSYNPPGPVVSTTPGPSDNTAIISQVSSPQHNSNHNEVTTKATTSSIDNEIVTSTKITTIKSTEVAENRTFKIKTLFTKAKSHSKASPKPKVTHITLDYYLENISNERLRRMPSRGSAWDRVLHAAQFFGLNISDFGDKINTFVNTETLNTLSNEVTTSISTTEGNDQEAMSNGRTNNVSTNGTTDLTTTALTATNSLLEIGYTQADALLPTFSILYEISVFFADIIRVYDLKQPSQVVLNAAIHTFHNLIVFLNGMRTLYQQKIGNLKPGSSETLEFGSDFRAKVEQIWRFKETLSNEIWKQKLETEGLSTNVNLLRSKLHLNRGHYVPNRIFEKADHYANISTEVGYWLKNVLSDDDSGQIVCVTGGESSGKTFLAGWIEERLARPINVKSNHVIRYDFPYDLPSEPSPNAFLKNILYKLLEENVGNIDLYNSIMKAFEQHFAEADSEPTEFLLWQALHDSLKAIRIKHASIVIILDGCEGIAGGDAEFYKKLQTCIHELSHIRVVTFSRSIPESVREYKYVIPNFKVEKDIETYFFESLSRSYIFNNLSSAERKQLFKTIMTKANENWLWTFYAAQFLSEEQSKTTLLKAGHDMDSDILLKVMKSLECDKLSLRNHSLKSLLSTMLVVTRPLTIAEAAQILSIDLHRHMNSVSPTPFDVAALISNSCCGLVIIRDGYIHFRTKAVRVFMKSQLGSVLLPAETEVHRQLTLSMLLYAKITLKGDTELTMDALHNGVALSTISADSLLEYVVENWIVHFQRSDLSESEVIHVFPRSTTLLLLEKTCWSRVYTKEQLFLNHSLALQIRQACFGEHTVVLYALITLGYLYLDAFGSNVDAAWYFYMAAKLGEKILTAKSAIVYKCVSYFFDYTTALDLSSRIEITTIHSKEKVDIVECYVQMIQLAIKIDQNKHGYYSDQVISWYKKLTKLYIDIKEEECVIDVYKQLYTATASRYGSDSEEAKGVYRYFVTLDIVFNDPSVDRVGELEQLIFGIGKEFTDYLCIKNWLWLANTFERCKHLFEAERLYVSLWQSISIMCDQEADVNINSIKIDVALEYVKFLRRQGREKDASSILICLSAEYKEYKEYSERTTNGESEESEAIIKYITRIRDVAEECRATGLANIALSILKNVWRLFSSKGYNKETQNTANLITEVIEEITETTITKRTTTTITVTESTEKVVKEVFEYLVDQYQHDNESDITLFLASKALINVYNQQKNWRDTEETLKKTLQSTWSEILIAGSEIKLPQYSIEECLDLAHRLADCYSTQGLFSMAEEIHSQIFAACSALKLEDNLRTKSNPLTGAELYKAAADSLVAFYEEHHRHTEAINIHIKVLDKYEKELGTKHESTIKTLYLLADRYMTLGHEEAYIYYESIVNVLNEGLDYCHHEALKAALALSKHYDARSLWDNLHIICNVLWAAIIRYHGEGVANGQYKIEAETIASVYDKYSYVLDFHAKAEFSKQYGVAVEYRDMITKTSNNEALIVKTLIALAKICETHKDYYQISVNAYEEVLKKVTTDTKVTTDITVQTVKKLLSRIYVTMIEESQPTEFEPEHAIAVTLETYHKHKDEFKTNPDQALGYLKNVILLYRKFNASERIYQFLEEEIKYVLTIATVDIDLFRAAHEFATLFAMADLTQKGRDLLHKMRKSITHGHQHSHKDTQPDLESQMKKVVFIFLIVFAHGLEQPRERLSYSKVMTENVLEFLLLEKYSQKIKEEAKVEVLLEYGAKLRHFWRIHQRREFVSDLDEELLKRFKAAFAQYFEANGNDEIQISFYNDLMEELGEDRPSLKFDFETFVLQVGNRVVKDLLDKNDFDKANQISLFIFRFSKEKKLYHHTGRIRYGCILAQYLVGIDASHPHDASDSEALLKTSLEIMADVIDAINALDIAFETLPSEDLIGLVHLLYRQSNYNQLERVLSPLWSMRSDLPTMFDSGFPSIVEIGTCLVHAQCAQNRWSPAIETVKELYYNLQRGLGRLHPETLAVSQLFSNVLVTAALGGDIGYASYAIDLHETVLTEIYRHSERVCNGYTRRDIQLLSKTAAIHLELLRKLLSRFKDSELEDMNKRNKAFHDLSAKLNADFALEGVMGDLPLWQYTLPKIWKFGEQEEEWNGADTLETSHREWVLASNIFY